MATTHEAQTDFVPGLRQERQSLGKTVVSWLTSTDHKVIGYLYLITSVVFFLIAGIVAMAMRLELWRPGMDLFQSKEQCNQFFTMHGTIILFLFAPPLFMGFGNVCVPLHFGAPAVASLQL